MSKIIKVSCIGLGGRGEVYLTNMSKQPHKYQIDSVCDIKKSKLDYFKKLFKLDESKLFNNENEFLKKKRGDLLVISIQDQDHVRVAIKALKLGYDILLEKPISNDKEEILELLKMKKKYHHKIFICHVLRYAPAFKYVKELLDKQTIGDLVLIDSIESVHYPHDAHSFVRGNWRNSNTTSPMILAKCCHDMDLMVWYTNSACESLSSIGDIRFFKKECQPKGAKDRCLNCKYKNTCVYSAYKIYVTDKFWGRDYITDIRPVTDKIIINALKTSPYGRCVFKCDNNVVDNEITIGRMKNNITFNLRMTAFTANGGRIMKFYGTYGEIELNEIRGKIYIRIFGKKEKEVLIKNISKIYDTHGGGDTNLVNDLYYFIVGKDEGKTTLEKSIESHLMCFAAEESRLNKGKLTYIKH